ncbi:pre-60S ribosomal particles component [Vermiconidia calcicola]|uniref:Pre-60S ribosomal particles component n=1 Tax=Vermiconidia calcicola TaxID=1690605 RepID=A0ACC3M9M6_9PEZI|nr:pre-60S ribosomal particles component [Vermiconidia calcicola]
MAPVTTKRRRAEDEVRRPKKKIRVKKGAQKAYHSSSEEESEDEAPARSEDVAPAKGQRAAMRPTPKSILKAFAPVQPGQDEELGSDIEGLDELDEAERNAALNAITRTDEDEEDGALQDDVDDDTEDQASAAAEPSEEDDDESEPDTDEISSLTSSQTALKPKKKRNDPAALATSISRILDTKLTTQKRLDPILSRSQNASKTHRDLQDSKLEHAARSQLRSERRLALQKGRVTDVLGLEDTSVETGKVQEEERRLKKTAQRGVVRLFNAVRAAQVKAEEAGRQARAEGLVGQKQRRERVEEMSKEGFLEMISKGGKGGVGV